MDLRTIAVSVAGFLATFGEDLAVRKVIAAESSVVGRAAIREAIRQDTTWTSENIQAHPYLFIQEQIRWCDKLQARIEDQNIALMRMGKQAVRAIKESNGAIVHYTNFLIQAKAAYKDAEKTGKWPVIVTGFELDEEQLCDRIADALERIELAKKDKTTSEVLEKKVKMRQDVLKAKARELQRTRLKLEQQSDLVKMSSELAKVGELTDILGTIKGIVVELKEDPTRLSIEEATSSDLSTKNKVWNFLND